MFRNIIFIVFYTEMPLRQKQYKHAAAMIKSIVTGIKELTRHIMSIMREKIRQQGEVRAN